MTVSPNRLAWMALLSASLGFALLQAIAYARAGVFEYPLDDVYIHLAMAEGFSQGNYGVNPGVPASASSSIIWPLFLLPRAGTEFQRMLPLVLNFMALLGCGWLWGRAVAASGVAPFWAITLAVLGPLALNIPGVAFVGMENEFHALVSMVLVFGLWRFSASGQIAPWFIAALFLSPLVRLEGLALSLAAVGVIGLRGHPKLAVMLATGVVLPVLAFAGFLISLGLDPLPGSVLAKVQMVGTELGPFERIFATLLRNLETLPGILLALLTVVTGLLPLFYPVLLKGPARPVLAVLTMAGAAHMLFAQIGWMHRYEHYILLSLLCGLLLSVGEMERTSGESGRRTQWVIGLAVVVAAVGYWPKLLGYYVSNPLAIHLQQAQMARFAKDFWNGPVAVNDLGWVSWNNDQFVLDLWGLGSEEVRHILFNPVPPPNGWADPLVKEHDVHVAMIYDHWFRPAVGPDWVRLGMLTMDERYGKIGGWEVTFYATSAEDVPRVIEAMRAFAPTLPAGAYLSIDGAGS